MQFTCDDKATLVSYLYGELDPATRRAVDDHLATCAPCAAEVTSLGAVRSELGLWAAPDAELDFTIVKKSQLPSNVLRPARWWTTVPAWAQAAAAVLVIGAGASIANLQIKSGPEGFSVTTGWMTPAAAPEQEAAVDRDAIGRQVEGQLASLEQKLRDEIRASRDQDVARVAATSTTDEATIRRVQQLIADAEQRHSQELARRFVEFANDMTMQRRADLMNVQRALTTQEAQMFRQRQMLNNAIRVSNTQQ